MTRFALIDNGSGYVWGVVEAPDMIAACRALDEDLGSYGRTYAEVPRFDFSNQTGYHVHVAPAGWEPDDGQDQDVIAAVEAMPLGGRVLVTGAAEA